MYYPLVVISGAHVRMVNKDYAADDAHLFYKGLLIEHSDAASAQVLHYGKGQYEGREDFHYLLDAHSVYYKGIALSDAAPAAFKVFVPDEGEENRAYGFDSVAHEYYFAGKKFPAIVDQINAHELRVLLADQAHAYHDLFINEYGIFYWDTQRNALQLACTTPPVNLRPAGEMRSAFTDGQALYTITASEVWSGNKSPGLKSRTTSIYKVQDVAFDHLQQQEEVMGRHGYSIGRLWQDDKNQTFFEPRFTRGNFFNSSLYQVKDVTKLREAAASEGDSDLMRTIKPSLAPVSGNIVCEATTDY